MRIPRLYIDVSLQVDSEIALSASAAAHAVRVLRLHAGDAIVLFNGNGHEYTARLVATNSHSTTARILARRTATRESPLRITLAQALARGEKMDWIVQKATELGVAAIVPLLTERSGVKLEPGRAVKRVQHWHAIVVAACEQCGRCVIPAISPPLAMQAWLATLDPVCPDTRLMLHPVQGMAPRALQPAPRSAVLAVGPEGGFGEGDLTALRGAGFRELGLGPRILRTETAGLAAITALQALYGDL